MSLHVKLATVKFALIHHNVVSVKKDIGWLAISMNVKLNLTFFTLKSLVELDKNFENALIGAANSSLLLAILLPLIAIIAIVVIVILAMCCCCKKKDSEIEKEEELQREHDGTVLFY